VQAFFLGKAGGDVRKAQDGMTMQSAGGRDTFGHSGANKLASGSDDISAQAGISVHNRHCRSRVAKRKPARPRPKPGLSWPCGSRTHLPCLRTNRLPSIEKKCSPAGFQAGNEVAAAVEVNRADVTFVLTSKQGNQHHPPPLTMSSDASRLSPTSGSMGSRRSQRANWCNINPAVMLAA